ncbi:MAG TPA: TIM-barrel domain-containing protein [Actinophytocola sp.]|uniref:TIM-barrel domain-containing protein n=1 Tax=Actinophytocola sp. TaxID=1872138 RepID=UPI002DB9ADEA|nr:TIM-barrel domain-containing protein [Actinophytocola sp.]HEU5475870.1 TIM-barrel domain-containing protein [Actinophytocola sp.]
MANTTSRSRFSSRLFRPVVLLGAVLSLVAGPLATAVPAGADAASSVQRHGATVTAGPVRIQVISPTLLRLEYAEDRRFEDRPSFVAAARDLRPSRFTVVDTRAELRVRTDAVELRYRKGSGRFQETNTTLELMVGDRRVRVHPAFGSPARPDALGGWYRGLDYYPEQAGPVEGIRLHEGLLHRDGWYLLDDTATALRTADGWVTPRPARTGAYQDGYLFGYGHDYQRALRDLRTLTGPTPLLPKWAFGNWFSEYQAFSDRDYRDSLLPAFRANEVPIDALVIDTDWKAPNAWAGWNWNSELFPDPPSFLRWTASQNLQTVLNVHAAISADDPRYAQAQALAGGRIAPATRSFAPTAHRFDWTDRAQYDAWRWLHEPFENQGVRQWWLDYCCDDSTAAVAGVTPDSWVNERYQRDAEARGLRGFALSRMGASFPDYTTPGGSGAWGEHRSTVHFTGDTMADWPSIAFAAAMTPAEGSVGVSYVSHDIGSFAGRHLPEDLYLRWVQLGAFQPILRLHSDHGDRLPWEYSAAVAGPAMDFLRLRESLVPYLYAAARESYDSGLPMARALYLEWPDRDEAYRHPTQYLLGPDLLVAPAVVPGLATTSMVWFPPGTWTDVFTGETYAGPATVPVTATPQRFPVFARAGAIVPRAADAPNVATQPADALTLTVYPHGSGQTSLYDDAGEGLGYRDHQYATTAVRYAEHAGQSELRIEPPVGRYTGQPAARAYTAVFVDVTEPRRVTVNGRAAQHRYEPASRTLTVDVPPVRRGSGAVVRHDGRAVTVPPAPAVDFALEAPDGLVAGVPSRVVGTVRNSGPRAVTGITVTLPQPDGWTITPTSPTTAARLEPGAQFAATFQVTAPGPARGGELLGHARYVRPDGRAVTLPAVVAVRPRPIQVTFRTLAPPGTPAGDTLYLPGNIEALGPWDPGKLAMTDRGGGVWEATLTIDDGSELQYKYTRGNWDTVEWWGGIVSTNNRSVVIAGDAEGTMLVDDTSTAWDDPSVPDIHKAPRTWRDPVVVSTTPEAGSSGPAPASVTVRFQRDVDPTGPDFSGSVTVSSGGTAVTGTVTELTPGILTWSPAASLPAGTYAVEVAAVRSVLSADSVPIQRPYRYTFTVT